ncbi:MAG: DUF4296 domain-containing protein [Bacteroidota bacterium]
MLAFICVCLLSFSCNKQTGNEEKDKGKGRLTTKQMVAVLVDIHLTEAALREKQNQLQNYNYYTNYYYSGVFKKHGLTQESFHQSMLSYKDDLKSLEIIYKRVVDSLSRMQGPTPTSKPVL